MIETVGALKTQETKMTTEITYKTESSIDGMTSITLPVDYRDWRREPGCKDIILRRALAIDCPLEIYIQITTQGKINLMKTGWCDNNNTYWHLYDAPDTMVNGKMHYLPITDAQARALTLIFVGGVTSDDILSDNLPLELLDGLGATPQQLLSDRGGLQGMMDKLGIPNIALA